MNHANQVFYEPTGKRWIITKILVVLTTILMICGLIFLFTLWKQNKNAELLITNDEYRTQFLNSKKIGVNIYPELNNQYSSLKENFENINRINCYCAGIKKTDKQNTITVQRTDDFDLINKFRSKVKDLKQEMNLVISNKNIQDYQPELPLSFDNENIEFNSVIVDLIDYSPKTENLIQTLIRDQYNVSLSTKDVTNLPKNIDYSSITHIYLDLGDNNTNAKNIVAQNAKFKDFNESNKTNFQLSLVTPSQSFDVSRGQLDPYSQIEYEKALTSNKIAETGVDKESGATLLKNNKLTLINFDDVYYYNLLNQLKTENILDNIESINLNNISNHPDGIFTAINEHDKLKSDYLFNSFIDKQNENMGSVLDYKPSVKGNRLVNYQDGLVIKVKYNTYPKKGELTYKGMINNKIAISFDDGPDPEITPKVLAILNDKGVKATFYIVGSRAAKYPDIVKQIISEGHIVANHSYTHSPLSNLKDKALNEEIIQTQEVIKRITGEYPKLMRTPFNDSPYHAKEGDLRIVVAAQNNKLIVSEFDTDPNDWRIDRTAEELFNLSTTNPKSQLLLHDIGRIEEKQAMLKALPKILDYYKTKNIAVVSTYDLLQVNAPDMAKKSTFDIGSYLTPSFILNKTKESVDLIILIFTILSLFFLILIRIFWIIKVNVKTKEYPPYTPPVSIIIPGYNEESVCIQTVESLIKQNYPDYEIIYVDDGSKDRSFEILKFKYMLNKRIRVYKKPNGGKASALNFGINLATNDIVILVDADTQFKKNSIVNLVRHFQDPKIGAVAGNVQVGNDYFTQKVNGADKPSFNFLTIFQRLEYITSQNFFREAFELVNIITIVSGAIGAYRKDAIKQVGGISVDTLAEDGNLSFDVLKMGWKIVYERDAISLTEAPENLNALFKQRVRWAFGNIQVLWKNRNIMLNAKFRWLGLVAMPFAWNCFIGLVIGPFISMITVGYGLYDFAVNGKFTADSKLILTALFWYAMFMIVEFAVVFVSIWRDPSKAKFRLLPFFFVYTFIFPFFLFIVSISVLIKIFKGTPQGWGHLKRTGTVFLKQESN
jgi:cellulose synthase/poly-beta-1,6-N-acetylglucosamine synthase-like glycosyltransferase/peptidoglycan/xylan/chitin deacetylase (PgdA/CDA1 family)